jgi:hypothetical protein
MKFQKLVLLLSMASALVACGGGGAVGVGGGTGAGGVDTATPAPPSTATATPTPFPVLTDKYTATWKNCSSAGISQALVITKNSDNAYTVDFKTTAHSGFPCTSDGTILTENSGTAAFNIIGTKIETRLNATVDKITDPTGVDKDIIYIKDGITFTDGTTGSLLYLGDGTGTIDADGFPNALDTFQPFRKQ